MVDNRFAPAMPGTVRTVQIFMWISVVLSVVLLALGALGLIAVSAFAGDPELDRLSAELPPMGLMWALMLASVVLVVVELVLVIRIPGRRAGTRTGIIWFSVVSVVIGAATAVLTADYVANGISMALSALLAALLLSDSAKRYFAN